MTARVEAGRLSHADLGKTASFHVAPKETVTGALAAINHYPRLTYVKVSGHNLQYVLDPHTLVSITGKEAHA